MHAYTKIFLRIIKFSSHISLISVYLYISIFLKIFVLTIKPENKNMYFNSTILY